jgi:hypothetical protein
MVRVVREMQSPSVILARVIQNVLLNFVIATHQDW